MSERRAHHPAALITGANGGIGTALCNAFADAGYHVIATDLAPKTDLPYPYFPLDLADLPHAPKLQTSFRQQVEAETESRGLRVCVNNAAVQILGHLEQIEDDAFQRTLDVNLFAPLILARLCVPLLAATSGSIINIGSIHAHVTKPAFVAYATSKAALLGLTRALAVDLGPRVRVNAIQPAAISTEMLRAGFADNHDGLKRLAAHHPTKRIGTPEEIARLAVFLASGNLPFLSGAAIDVDGAIGARLHDPD